MRVEPRLYFLLIAALTLVACDRFDEEVIPDKSTVFRKFFGGFNEQLGADIMATTDGGFLALGSSSSFSGENANLEAYLVKTDPQGNEMWSRTFGVGEEGFDVAGIALDEMPGQSGFVILGSQDLNEDDVQGVILFFTDNDGNEISPAVGFGDSTNNLFPTGFDITSDGGVVITATLDSASQTDIKLIRTDEDGNKIGFGETNIDLGSDELSASVMQITDSDGSEVIALFGSVLVGAGQGPEQEVNSLDMFFMKVKADGTPFNQRTYEIPGSQSALYFSRTADGGFALLGDNDVNDNNILFKIDINGNEIWRNVRPADSNNDIVGSAIKQIAGGGFVIVGNIEIGETEENIFLDRTDALGNSLEGWPKNYGGAREDLGANVIQTADGGFLVVGSNNFEGNNSLITLIKTNSRGDLIGYSSN